MVARYAIIVGALLACATAHGQSLFASNVRMAARRSASVSAYTPPQFASMLFWFPMSSSGTATQDMTTAGTCDLILGTSTAAPTWTGANTGYDFDGTNDFARTTSTSVFNGKSEGTLAFWATRDTNVHGTYICTGSNDSVAAGMAYQSLTAYIRGGAKGGWANPTSGTPTLGVWYHFAVTYRSADSSPRVRSYIDGVLNGTGSAGSGNLSQSTAQMFGCLTVGSGHFNGRIDDAGAWSVKLTSNEVYNMYLDTKAAHGK